MNFLGKLGSLIDAVDVDTRDDEDDSETKLGAHAEEQDEDLHVTPLPGSALVGRGLGFLSNAAAVAGSVAARATAQAVEVSGQAMDSVRKLDTGNINLAAGLTDALLAEDESEDEEEDREENVEEVRRPAGQAESRPLAGSEAERAEPFAKPAERSIQEAVTPHSHEAAQLASLDPQADAATMPLASAAPSPSESSPSMAAHPPALRPSGLNDAHGAPKTESEINDSRPAVSSPFDQLPPFPMSVNMAEGVASKADHKPATAGVAVAAAVGLGLADLAVGNSSPSSPPSVTMADRPQSWSSCPAPSSPPGHITPTAGGPPAAAMVPPAVASTSPPIAAAVPVAAGDARIDSGMPLSAQNAPQAAEEELQAAASPPKGSFATEELGNLTDAFFDDLDLTVMPPVISPPITAAIGAHIHDAEATKVGVAAPSSTPAPTRVPELDGSLAQPAAVETPWASASASATPAVPVESFAPPSAPPTVPVGILPPPPVPVEILSPPPARVETSASPPLPMKISASQAAPVETHAPPAVPVNTSVPPAAPVETPALAAAPVETSAPPAAPVETSAPPPAPVEKSPPPPAPLETLAGDALAHPLVEHPLMDGDKASLLAERNQLLGRVEELQACIKDLEVTSAGKDTQLMRLSEKLVQVESDLADQTTSTTVAKQEAARASAGLQELQLRQAELQKQVGQAQDAAKKAAAAAREAAINEVRAEVEKELEGMLKSKDNTIKAFKTQAAKAEADFEEAARALERRIAQVEELQTELESMKQAGASRDDGHKEQLTSVEAGYQKRIEELEERVQADERERQELALNVQGVEQRCRGEVRQLELQKGQLEAKTRTLELQLEEKEQRCAEVGVALGEAMQQVAQLQRGASTPAASAASAEVANARVQALEEQIRSAESRFAEAEAGREKLMKELELSRSELRLVCEGRRQLQEELATAHTQCRQLQSALEKSQAQDGAKPSSKPDVGVHVRNDHRDEVHHLRKKLEEKETRIEQLRTESGLLRAELRGGSRPPDPPSSNKDLEQGKPSQKQAASRSVVRSLPLASPAWLRACDEPARVIVRLLATNPYARLMVFGYAVIIHVWVLVVLHMSEAVEVGSPEVVDQVALAEAKVEPGPLLETLEANLNGSLVTPT